MKKFLSLLIAAMIFLANVSSVFAIPETEYPNFPKSEYNIISQEFPDAYILTNIIDPREIHISADGNEITINNTTPEEQNDIRKIIEDNPELKTILSEDSKSLGQIITATVFVEEEHAVIDGKLMTTSSRLLSKSEVEAIGIENFESLGNQNLPSSKAATNSRGKLTITFSGSGSHSQTASQYTVSAKARWDGFNFLYSATNNPAVGEDFFGLAWGGGFTYRNVSYNAKWNNGGTQSIYLSDAVPNAGLVCSFYEYRNVSGKYNIYVSEANLSANLYKNKLTGNGNTTEVICKYIHTYQSSTGSISFSASPSGVGAGFSLGGTDKQWSIVCTITNLYY